MPPGSDRLVLLGVVTAAHGVRGLVKVRSFTADPSGLTAYGPLCREDGRPVALKLKNRIGELWLAEISGVADREAAEALKGTGLYVPRAALPEDEDEDAFYVADLEGLAVEDREGRRLGRVRSVEDHGAGDVIEIELEAGVGAGRSVVLPFTRAVVPVVDVAGGRIVVDPPVEVTVPPGGEGA